MKKTRMQIYWEWRMDNAETIGEFWTALKSGFKHILDRRKKWLRVAQSWRKKK